MIQESKAVISPNGVQRVKAEARSGGSREPSQMTINGAISGEIWPSTFLSIDDALG
jgi:hypothetical protein